MSVLTPSPCLPQMYHLSSCIYLHCVSLYPTYSYIDNRYCCWRPGLKVNNTPSITSPTMDRGRMRRGHWLGSMLYALFNALILVDGWVTGRTSGPLKPCSLSQRFSSRTGGWGRSEGKQADPRFTWKKLLLLLHPFNSLFFQDNMGKSDQKGKPFWVLLEIEVMGWQWHQLDHMQIICTSLQTDNLDSTSPLSFYRPDVLPATQPTVSKHFTWKNYSLKTVLVVITHCNLFARRGERLCKQIAKPVIWTGRMLWIIVDGRSW